jgi:hypothetical protein
MKDLQTLKSDRERATVVTVTPALAQELLNNSIGNRALRKGVVERYAREMSAKLWNCEAPIFIMVDQRARLIDGHHRLTALIRAGVTLPLRFMLGVDPVHMAKLDGGEIRTLGDRFTAWCQDKAVRDLVGASPGRATQAAAIVGFVYKMLTGQQKPGLEPAIRIVRHYKDSLDYALTVCGANHITRRSAVMAAVTIAHRYAQQAGEIKRLTHFTESLVSGEMLEAGEPAFTLRNYLISTKGKRDTRNVAVARVDSQWVIFVKTLHCMRLALEGQLTRKLIPPRDPVAAIEYFTGDRRELARALRLDAALTKAVE